MSSEFPAAVSGLLATHPLFSLLSEDVRVRCVAALHTVTYRTGETVFHAGQEGDAACFVVEGRVRIVREGSGVGASLGTFRAGTFFAAHARPEQWVRTAGCRAAEDSLILHLPRAAVEELLARHSELAPYLDRTVEESVLLETLSLGRLLAAVPGSEIIAALDVFQPVVFRAGDIVVRQGEHGDAMYVVRRGILEVRRRFPEGDRRLRDLLPGDYFGERALVLGGVRSSTVVASEDCECFKLERSSFDRLRNLAPSFTKPLVAKFAVYEATEQDVAQHADVRLVPVAQNHGSGVVGSQAMLGSGVSQFHLLGLLELTEFMQGLPGGNVPAVVSCLRTSRFERGTRLPQEGLFVIRSGKARRRGDRSSQTWLVRGDVFGALQALNQARAPQYVATDDVELLGLDSRALTFLAENVPAWGTHLRRLADLESLRTPATEVPESIAVLESAPTAESAPATEAPLRSGACLTPDQERRVFSPSGKRRPIRWIGQESPNSCGLAALAMVMHAHGVPGNYDMLHARCELLPRGLTLLQMHRLAEASGFAAEIVEVGLDDVQSADLPAIALWDESHYVVLFRLGKATLIVGDPAIGLIKMTRARMSQMWSGRLLLLQPAPARIPSEIVH